MTRTELINMLIDKHGYKSYLEIGVNTPAQPGYNWVGINAETKHGVDPNVETTYKMTSDEFFKGHISQSYDIIFIDGLHLYEQVHRDIVNSLEHLTDGGCIVVHDCNPVEEITQRRERASDAWHGDVWRAIVRFRMNEPHLSMCTVDTDEGCCVIRHGSQVTMSIPSAINPYEYSFLENNRKHALNLVSVEDFVEFWL
jgi:predicted O-methyltransferase YrrM